MITLKEVQDKVIELSRTLGYVNVEIKAADGGTYGSVMLYSSKLGIKFFDSFEDLLSFEVTESLKKQMLNKAQEDLKDADIKREEANKTIASLSDDVIVEEI